VSDRDWYETAFEGGYLDVYPHRDLASARREASALVARGLDESPMLDLGCGFGRHTLAFAELGLDVCGLDLSIDLLSRARELEGARRLAGRLARGDFRRLPYRSGSFGAVAMLFSSFGYFDDAANGVVLAEVARVLRRGGTLVLDLMNAARVRATLVPESRTEACGRLLLERRALTDGGRRVRKDVELRESDGSLRRWHEDVRLYDPPELRRLLAANGLELMRTEGDFDGAPDTDEAPRRIVWARAGGGRLL